MQPTAAEVIYGKPSPIIDELGPDQAGRLWHPERNRVVLIEPSRCTPTHDQVRKALSCILTSEDFRASRQLSRFLRYIVETSLAGQEDRIKERTVALHALDRETDFDPRLDPIVRMVAGKLRRALDRFYAGEGANQPLRIEIAKGGYRPAFTTIAIPESEATNSTNRPPAKALLNGLDMTRRPVVAVVPFVTFTQGAQERLLADSIAQDVCVGLSKFTWFEVIDYVVARSQCHQRNAPFDVAARLHADFCIIGTIRQNGEAFRATVQLTDTCKGAVVWAHEFGLASNVFDASDFDIAIQRIVATIGDIFGVLARAVWMRAQRKSVHELSACEAVLANLHYQSDLADGVYSSAARAAKRALKVDPDFAWGWAAMATLHLDGFALIAKGGASNASEQSMGCIHRALKADPSCAFAHWTLALHHLMHGRTEETVRAAEISLEHARGSPFEIGATGALLSAAGDHDRGQALIDLALEINPRLPGWVHWGTAINNLQRGEHENALATIRRFSLPNCFWDHVLRAAAMSQAGEKEQARLAASRAHQLRPELGDCARDLISRIVQEGDVQERIMEGMAVSKRLRGLRSRRKAVHVLNP